MKAVPRTNEICLSEQGLDLAQTGRISMKVFKTQLANPVSSGNSE